MVRMFAQVVTRCVSEGLDLAMIPHLPTFDLITRIWHQLVAEFVRIRTLVNSRPNSHEFSYDSCRARPGVPSYEGSRLNPVELFYR
jgi:hypothetical protein